MKPLTAVDRVATERDSLRWVEYAFTAALMILLIALVRQVGRGRNCLFGEVMYIVHSLVAQSVLARQIFAITMIDQNNRSEGALGSVVDRLARPPAASNVVLEL